MSEAREALKEASSFDGVPLYRVTLVRESTAAELPSIPIRKSSEAAAILRPLFAGLDREQFVEAAQVLRINPQFSLEMHKQRMPIRDPTVLARRIAALRKAGFQ